jgi:hypothetical protein
MIATIAFVIEVPWNVVRALRAARSFGAAARRGKGQAGNFASVAVAGESYVG